MADEVRYFVADNRQKNGVEILHFDRLCLAIRAYNALPQTGGKTLGVQAEGRSADLAQCVPIRPGDEEGEDVIALDFLRGGFGDARPALIKAAQNLAECLRVRYCLSRGCLLQVPTKQTLPKRLQGRYLWPAEPGKFETAIQWIKVVGVGSLSPTEFKRRYVVASSISLALPQTTAAGLAHSAAPPFPTKPEGRLCGDPSSDESAASTYPLVLRLNVHSRTEDGRFCSLDVTPWEFMLLAKCSKERCQDKNFQYQGGIRTWTTKN